MAEALSREHERVARLLHAEQGAAQRSDPEPSRQHVAEDLAAHDEGARAAQQDLLRASGVVPAADLDPIERGADRRALIRVERGVNRFRGGVERPLGVRVARRTAVARGREIGGAETAPDRGRVARVAATISVEHRARRRVGEPEHVAGGLLHRGAGGCAPPRGLDASRVVDLTMGVRTEVEALFRMPPAIGQRIGARDHRLHFEHPRHAAVVAGGAGALPPARWRQHIPRAGCRAPPPPCLLSPARGRSCAFPRATAPGIMTRTGPGAHPDSPNAASSTSPRAPVAP